MKIILDVNLSPKWIAFLRDVGHAGVCWTDIGRETDEDEVIMRWARENGAVVLTCDLDFSAMLAASGDAKPSVVQLRPGRLRPELLVGRLRMALGHYEQALNDGVLLTIDFGTSRVQRLPLIETD